MTIINIQGHDFDLREEDIKKYDNDTLNLAVFSTIFDYHNPERYGKIGSCQDYAGNKWMLLIKRLNELNINVKILFLSNGKIVVELIGGHYGMIHSICQDETDMPVALCMASLYYWLEFGINNKVDDYDGSFAPKEIRL